MANALYALSRTSRDKIRKIRPWIWSSTTNEFVLGDKFCCPHFEAGLKCPKPDGVCPYHSGKRFIDLCRDYAN